MHSLPKLAGLSILLLAAAPVLARPTGWGQSGWGDTTWGSRGWERDRIRPQRGESRPEGEVEVTRFVAQDGTEEGLGKGPISVVATVEGAQAYRSDDPIEHSIKQAQRQDEGPADMQGPPDRLPALAGQDDSRRGATFEAAVIDQLVIAGYDTLPAAAAHGQRAELRIVHGLAEPAELPHKPVSGTMEVGVSNHGSMAGMGINIDLTKPKKALLSTRLEARIRDGASGAVLWEGRAEIATRDGDANWPTQKIAARLAEALFRDFPGKPGETYSMR